MARATLTRVLSDLETLEPDELQIVDDAIHAKLPGGDNKVTSDTPTVEQIQAANALLRQAIVALPFAIGTDNKTIDADLVREYSDEHESAV